MRITISEIAAEVKKALGSLPTAKTGPNSVGDRGTSSASILQRIFLLLVTSPSVAFELYGEALSRKAALLRSYLESIRAFYGESYLGGLPQLVPGLEDLPAASQKLVRAVSGLSRFELVGAGDGVSGQYLNTHTAKLEEVAQQFLHTVQGISEREARKRLREQTLAMDAAFAAISLSDLEDYVTRLTDTYMGSGTLSRLIPQLQLGLMRSNYKLVTDADFRDDAGQIVVRSMVAKTLVETLTSKSDPVGQVILEPEEMVTADDDLLVESAGGFTVLDTVLLDGVRVSTDTSDPRLIRITSDHQLAHRMRVETVDTPFYSSLSGGKATLYTRLVTSDSAAKFVSSSSLSSVASKSADIREGDYLWIIDWDGGFKSSTVLGVDPDEGTVSVTDPIFSEPVSYASITVPGLSTPDGDIKFTSTVEGSLGNLYAVRFRVDAGISSSPEIEVVGYSIFFIIDALPWSGADVIADAINADPAASQLVIAEATGTASPDLDPGDNDYYLEGAVDPYYTVFFFRSEYEFFADDRVNDFIDSLYGVRAVFTHPEDGDIEVYVEAAESGVWPGFGTAIRTSSPLGYIHTDAVLKLPVSLEDVEYRLYAYPRTYSLLESEDDDLYSLIGSRVRVGTTVNFEDGETTYSAGVQDVLSMYAFTVKPVIPPGTYWALFSDFARAGDVFVVDDYGRFTVVDVLGPKSALVNPTPPEGMSLANAKLVTADSVRFTRRLRDQSVDFVAAGVEPGHVLVANLDTGSVTSKVVSVTSGVLTVESQIPVDLNGIRYEVRRRIDDRTSWVDVSSTANVEASDAVTIEGYPSKLVDSALSSSRLLLSGGFPVLDDPVWGVVTRGGAEGYSGYALSQHRLFSSMAAELRDPSAFRQQIGALLFDLGTDGSSVLSGSDARFPSLESAHDRLATDVSLDDLQFGDNLHLTVDGDEKIVHVVTASRGLIEFFPVVAGSSVASEFSVSRNEISDALYELRQIELTVLDVLAAVEGYVVPRNTGARSLLDSLRTNGYDRARDLLLDGDFSELTLGGQAALSYASKLEEAVAQSMAVLGDESDLVLLDPKEGGPVGGSRI